MSALQYLDVNESSPNPQTPIIKVNSADSSEDLRDHHLQPQTIQWEAGTQQRSPNLPARRRSTSINRRNRLPSVASRPGSVNPDEPRASYNDDSESERDLALTSPTLPPSAMPSGRLTDNRSFHDNRSFQELELPLPMLTDKSRDKSDNISLSGSSSSSSLSLSPDEPRGEDFRHHHRSRYHRSRQSTKARRRANSDARAFNTLIRPAERDRRPTNTDSRRPVVVDPRRQTQSDNRSRAPTVSSVVESDDDHSQVDSEDNNSEKAEEDVCFPMTDDELRDRRGIDFEVMEEFAREMRELLGELDLTDEQRRAIGTPKIHPVHRNRSGSRVSTFDDRRDVRSALHHHPAFNPKLELASSSDSVEDEKLSSRLPKLSRVGTTGSATRPDRQPRSVCCGDRKHDRFTFFTPSIEETISVEEFCDLVNQGETYSQLFDQRKGTWWLDVLNPSVEEMRMLSKAFNIHPLTNEDIRTQESREKVELFRTYYFVCFRSFQSDPEREDYLEAANMYIVVFRGGLLTFHFTTTPHAANVRRRIRQLRDYVCVSSDWICYALIDDITDAFGPSVNMVEVETETIEDDVMVVRGADIGEMLKRITLLRKKILGLLKLLGGKADVIKMFAKRCNEHWDVAPTGEIGLYLGDIQDHIVTMTQNLSTFEKILSRSHGNYLSYLSVDSMYANNRINSLLGKLTLFTVIIVPMNLVTGLWGMNVPVPGRETESLAWFFGIVGAMIGWGVLFIVLMWRLRFLSFSR